MLTNKTFSGITKIQAYRSDITLRGHPGETMIVSGDTACAITSQQMLMTGAANLDSGYTRGSTSIVFSASPAAGFSVGNLMLIDAADDTNQLIYVTTGPGRRMRTTHKILTVSGTTVTFDPPIPYTFTSAQTPKASYMNGTPLRRFGFEDIIVDPGDSETERAFDLYGTDECWMRNVVGTNTTDESVSLYGCHRTEIRDSYFGDVDGYPANPDGYGIYSRETSSWGKFEANRFNKLGVGILFSDSSCNWVGYNFATNINFGSGVRQTGAYNVNHGAGGMMNAFEGNVGSQWQDDAYHGSSHRSTIYRNWLHAIEGTQVDKHCPIDMPRGSYYNQIVGNILGHPSWTNEVPFAYMFTNYSLGFADTHCIYRFGFASGGNNNLAEPNPDSTWQDDYPWITYLDQRVTNTVNIHANFDFYTHTQVMNPAVSGTLYNSLVYSSHPTNLAVIWPPFDPTSEATALLANPTNIQAGHRFYYGTNFANFEEGGGGDPAIPAQRLTLNNGNLTLSGGVQLRQ
jgi:hypothetical protein